MVGIIEEQHPDRTRLFMQWKQMDWPIMVDALNLLDVEVIPITIFIDESGVIRNINPKLQNAKAELQKFLSTPGQPKLKAQSIDKKKGNIATSIVQKQARNLILWSNSEKLTQAISFYSEALKSELNNGALNFRLGVAHRMRYDSKYRRDFDFNLAVENWEKGLAINPNQYIWRRRIQQYGPRLDKPYPFYDWIFQARKDIKKRGEIPVELKIEPEGAEFALPLKVFEFDSISYSEPDPQGKITRDNGEFINIETVVVESTSKKQNVVRVHVEFLPNEDNKAHWNNEVENLKFWINPPLGWKVTSRYLEVKNPRIAVSKEGRKLEFEMKWPIKEQNKNKTLKAYALYYVCEDVNGTCLYRRQDIPIKIDLR